MKQLIRKDVKIMPRPKALEELPLECDMIINRGLFEIAYRGKIDSQGRIPTVGYAGHEVLIFIKRKGD